MRSHIIAALTLLIAVAGCRQQYATGSIAVSEGVNGVSLAGLHRGNQLVYAFAWQRDVPKTDTNDPQVEPASKGIHFLFTAPDGLWFQGERVAFPKESTVFALRRDGQVVPIPLTEAEFKQVIELTRPGEKLRSVPKGTIQEKLLRPFNAENEQR